MTDPAIEPRAAIVALIGAPNAGKSTLVNALVGQKVAAVTHKVQTTRMPLRGIALVNSAQLVLIDTPGVFAPRRRLDRAMVAAAWASASDADSIVHVVDAPGFAKAEQGGADAADLRAHDDVQRIVTGLQQAGLKAVLVLNKVDSMPRPALLAVSQKLFQAGVYPNVFMISALNGDGVADLAKALAEAAPLGPHLYPDDQVADAPARVLAAEITREKMMLRLHEEIPYETAVETESWEERKDGSARVEQTILVTREGHRKIAIGEGGRTIKAIGEAARKEMEAAFDRRIHLFLHVKVRENWSEERARFSAMGLDFDA